MDQANSRSTLTKTKTMQTVQVQDDTIYYVLLPNIGLVLANTKGHSIDT
jgi:hypothetical protein